VHLQAVGTVDARGPVEGRVVSFVNANFSLRAIVAQLIPSSIKASVAPPCT